MRDRLFSLPRIDSGEKYMVSMLFAQAVFLGIFFGAFDISAHSLFLSVFDIQTLAKGYIVSGIAGILILSLYFFIRTRMDFRRLAVLSMIFVSVVTLILGISLVISSGKLIIFILFILLGPLNILAGLGLKETTGHMTILISRKRFLTSAGIAMIIGLILICYAIPLLLSFNFDLRKVLFISIFAVIIATVIQIFVGSHLQAGTQNITCKPEASRRTASFLNIFRTDKYQQMLGIFVVLSVVSTFFIQYSFLSVTRDYFSSAEKIAMFLGIFTGSCMVLIVIGKLILFPFLVNSLGLKLTLAVSPVVLLILTVVSVASGMIMGYTPEAEGGFLIFFILLTLTRFLSQFADESIESPAFKLIYQTVDEKLRYEVQTIMDSTVREIALLLAGLILTGLGVLSFIKLIHFSWILLLLLFCWILFSFRLYTEYRKSIRRGLETLHPDDSDGEGSDLRSVFKGRFYGERAFRMDYFNLISGDISVFEKTENRFYFKKILDHTISRHDINLFPIIKKMAIRKIDEEIRQQSAALVKNMDELLSVWKREDERIISAKRTLSETRMPQTTEILRLLRDKSPESKRLAIYMIGKFRLSDMLSEVCECLNIPGLETDAATVLCAFGGSAEEELMRFYLVSSGNITTSKTILGLLSKLASTESIGFLFSRLWSNSRQLKEVALKGLIECGFKPSPEDRDRLQQLISDIIGLMAWNLAAKLCLEKSHDALLLGEIEKELKRWNRFLENVLSVTYDAASVSEIRKNLDSVTVEGVHHAYAIIDLIVDDSVKGKIISLMDVISDDEKFKNLSQFYPVEIPQYNKLLEDILNRDYNLLSLWTKACVLRDISGIPDDEMAESVVALLFSPESLLQEEAARLIARSNPELYRSAYSRIPIAVRRHLDVIINGGTSEKEFLFEKIQFLAGCFVGIMEDEMLLLARSMIYTKDIKTVTSTLYDDYLIWELSSGSNSSDTRIYYSVGIENPFEKGNRKNSTFYMLSLKTVDGFLSQYPDNADIIFTYLEKIER